MDGKNKTRKIVYTAVMVAIISILSALTVPTPTLVPLTLSVFAVSFSGYFLGVIGSLLAVGVYIVAGGVGLPIFSGFSGGFGVLLGPTGGFIFGYIPLVILSAIGGKLNKPLLEIGLSLVGVTLCHLIGVIQFSLVMGNGILESFIVVSLPYLLKDYILVAIAYFCAKRLKKILLK